MEIMISSSFVVENHGGPTRVIDSWELTAYITRDRVSIHTREKCLRKENSAEYLVPPHSWIRGTSSAAKIVLDASGPNQDGWQLGAHVVFCALMLIWASQTCLWARIFPKMNGLFWIL
ncbi:hypothetical protein D5086_013707 [Populus alba]|uniref:Uncharacterized protein n=1 Tax=Populus alba TaxID=43335 RepID=A0ACC4C5R3_POPAL